MRAAVIAAAVFAAFVGIMYLRFSGDTVPAPQPTASPGPAVAGPCVVARRADAPEPTPTPDGGAARAPCSVPTPLDNIGSISVDAAPPQPYDPLPRILKGTRITELAFGPEIELPYDMAFFIEGGCWQCDPPPRQLLRVYRRPAGEFAVELLFSPERAGLGPRLVEHPSGPSEQPAYVTGFAMNRGASEIIAAACTRGSCGAFEPISDDALTSFFRSTDGGITWASYGELPGVAYPLGLTASGTALASVQSPNTFSYRLIPSGEPVTTPTEAQIWPTVTSGGQIFWNAPARGTLYEDGALYLLPQGSQACCTRVLEYEPKDGTAFISTYAQSTSYLVDVGPKREAGRAFSLPSGIDAHLYIAKEGVVIGGGGVSQEYLTTPLPRTFFGQLPVVIYLREGEVRPIAGPFLEDPLMNARKTVYAVQSGPFERVINTEGTCLNVRAEAGAGQVLDCAAEGVLLRGPSDDADVGGVVWHKVTTPAGVEGWASTQYLEFPRY
jgi:hypothetical protein